MQDRPTAAELLETLAELLEGELLNTTSGGLKHQVRVAGNLCRILQRESELQAENDRRAATKIAELLGCDPTADGASGADVQRELARRLREDDDVGLERAAWPVLLETVRDKLAVNKPGHDDYDFGPEVEK